MVYLKKGKKTFYNFFLSFFTAHHRFNETQYLKEERDYVLGSLVRYKDQNKVCFELWAGDNFDAERFAKVFAVINERVNLGEKLYYRPMSQDQETRIAPVVEKNGFEIVTAKELFGNSEIEIV